MTLPPPPYRALLRRLGTLTSLAGFLLSAAAPGTAAAQAAAADADGEGAFAHVRALQAIAEANGGNRAAGTPGYDRSADYVAGRLRDAGYDVRFEEFTFPFFEERSPPALLSGPDRTPAPREELRTFRNSGAGDVTARLRPVDLGLPGDPGAAPPPSTSACEASDFDGFERGAIALVRRGACTFQVKVNLAAAAGAAGVVVMNEGTGGSAGGRTGAVSGGLDAAPIPVVGVGFALGRRLASEAQDVAQDVTRDGAGAVRLVVETVSGTRSTRNVLAELGGPGPRETVVETVVVGAHLDGVPDGPGMNDNASGSAAVLEAARQLARAASGARPTRRVRFAFWGAEELGLIGSRHHLDALPEERRREIVLYVNLDMVGSPNFGRFVQGARGDGDGLAAAASRALVGAFRSRGLPVEERSGRGPSGYGSDDASFARHGIPTVGLHTGASERKPDNEAALFGGTADRPYDPCYHRACDTAANVNRAVLGQMAEALARAVAALTNMGEALEL